MTAQATRSAALTAHVPCQCPPRFATLVFYLLFGSFSLRTHVHAKGFFFLLAGVPGRSRWESSFGIHLSLSLSRSFGFVVCERAGESCDVVIGPYTGLVSEAFFV